MAEFRLHLDEQAIAELARGRAARDLAQLAGDKVADTARGLAPRRTGAMAASIHAETGEDTIGAYADVSWDRDHFYGYFAERGTSHQSATPFLVPALDATTI